jgi:hypothetical protein
MANHPDSKFKADILKYIVEGAPIMYEGPEFSRICKNWDSTLNFKKHVVDTICADVNLGRKSGPFAYPPVAHFVGSPMGAFMKKRSSKIRTSHGLRASLLIHLLVLRIPL